jgi:hypothetical protein
VNGGARLDFRNQHQFDVLKAVDTSKKDLAAKRWMSCLVVSNGFRFEESSVQLNNEDVETLKKEREFFTSRVVPATLSNFFVPDHLAPRCHSCKLLFSVSIRRYHCRSCGLVQCTNCFKVKATQIVCLDERVKSRQRAAQASISIQGLVDDDIAVPLSETRLTAAVELSIKERAGSKTGPSAPSSKLQGSSTNSSSTGVTEQPSEPAVPGSPTGSADSFEDPPLAEEHPAVGPPISVVCPASMPSSLPQPNSHLAKENAVQPRRGGRQLQGLSREGRAMTGSGSDAKSPAPVTKTHKMCSSCAMFFEYGVGETYALLERKESMTQARP